MGISLSSSIEVVGVSDTSNFTLGLGRAIESGVKIVTSLSAWNSTTEGLAMVLVTFSGWSEGECVAVLEGVWIFLILPIVQWICHNV